MADFVSLSCPSCGGKLQITNDIDRFACGYCGQEHTVNRSGGMVFLKPVVEGLRQVQTGVDKTAAELALKRLVTESAGINAEIYRFNVALGTHRDAVRVCERVNKNILHLERERDALPFWEGKRKRIIESKLTEEKHTLSQYQGSAQWDPSDYENKLALLEKEKSRIEQEIAKNMKIVEG